MIYYQRITFAKSNGRSLTKNNYSPKFLNHVFIKKQSSIDR